MSARELGNPAGEVSDGYVQEWTRFFRERCTPDIAELAQAEPPVALHLDYWELDRWDTSFADTLLRSPNIMLASAREALKSFDAALYPLAGASVRVYNLPTTARVDVRNLRGHLISNMVAVRGIVRKATEIHPRVIDAAYHCPVCGAIMRAPQSDRYAITPPLECDEEQGGCGRVNGDRLKIILGALVRGQVSKTIDTQKVEIQENPDELRGGQQPERLTLWLDADLTREPARLKGGDRIVANGILCAAPRRSASGKGGGMSPVLDYWLEVVSIERESQEFEEITLTEEEEEAFLASAKEPGIYDDHVRSIAPEIYGMHVEKEAVSLALYGGVQRPLAPGKRLRGDIHILFVGDPGVAKSQFLRGVGAFAPRAVITTGKGTSAAGLTAAAVKDDFGEGRWTYEAGALPMADRGFALVDELDKMHDHDRDALHEAMEQQTATLTKAGMNVTLQTRCTIIAAANPRDGRFDKFGTLAEQIDLSPPLLSRFDLIFPIIDTADAARDGDLVDHIMRARKGITVPIGDVIPSDMLRKRIAYARRVCHPILTEAAHECLKRFYVDLRKTAGDGPMPVTARQLEALVRMTEASARIQFRQEAGLEDAERAVRLMLACLNRVAGTSTGGLDIDRISASKDHEQRAKIELVLDAVRELSAGNERGAHVTTIVEHLYTKHGMRERVARDLLKHLSERGQIMAIFKDHYIRKG